MLKWCSYCQQFIGEVPDFADFQITHGICQRCPQIIDLPQEAFERAHLLRSIQHRLFDAGRRNDLKTASSIVEEAEQAKIRPVDMLIGIVAPILYRIGDDWEKGAVTVEGEHRFTAFCEEVFDLIAPKIEVTRGPGPVETLLMNAPGNTHTLGIRILALWLASNGRRSAVIDPRAGAGEVVELIRARKPRDLLISMALAGQLEAVCDIVARVSGLPPEVRPRIIVGGYAVKLGLVPPMEHAELMADISSLH